MRAIALLCALCTLLGVPAAVAGTRGTATERTSDAEVVAAIGHYQHATWHWQRLMGLRHTKASFAPSRSTDAAYRVWVLRLWQRRAERLERKAGPWLTARIRDYQADVVHWRRVMGAGPLRRTAAAGGREQAFVAWRRLAGETLRRASNPPLETAWRCIHRYEGSWTDANGPYYGGLQMDLGFQRHYGGYLLRIKGTADHWTPLEQMWVAARAHRSGRGFWPWPNTARYCGLI